LIVDAMGKDISGTGMDTNVIGRKYNDHAATDRDDARCKRIFVRSLTPGTHGNATGIGLAEFTNRRTAESVDPIKTRINCITGGHPTAAMMPVVYDTDREAIEAALQTIGLIDPPRARVIHIADTLHVAEALVSEAYLPQLTERGDLTQLDEPSAMVFDATGNLVAVSQGYCNSDSPSHKLPCDAAPGASV
jgi:hypothetical protein